MIHAIRDAQGQILSLHREPVEGSEHLSLSDPAVQALLAELVTHVPVKQAATLMSELTGLPRKVLYDQALQLRAACDED